MEQKILKEFFFGYDLSSIRKVERYIENNYKVSRNHCEPGVTEIDQFGSDAYMWIGYGDDTMNCLEVYSEALLNDPIFLDLISQCEGKGNFDMDAYEEEDGE